MLRTIARVLAASLLPITALAQAPEGAVVSGQVHARSEGVTRPAANAVVSVDGRPVAVTAADGSFRLERVAAGTLTVRVHLSGYSAVERRLTLAVADTVRLELVLDAQAQVLAPVRSEVRPLDVERFEARPNVASISLDATAMTAVPALGEPDVARIVRLLPGVGSKNDFSTSLNVRGGEADQNLVLLDGHPIYNPFHLGGLFSTFMDATVGGLELLTAAFPVQYGGRLSSVLDVRSAEESRAGVHGAVDLSVLAATGVVRGASSDGRSTWSVAGRRTYADAAVSSFTTNVLPYHFQDFHAHAAHALGGGYRVALTGYAGRDVLDVNIARLQHDSVPTTASNGRYAFGWGNRVLGVALTREVPRAVRLPLVGWRLGDSASFEQRASFSDFAMDLDLGEGAFGQRNRSRDLRLSGTFVARGNAIDKSVGWEAAAHRLHFGAGSTETGSNDVDILQRPTTAAAWTGVLWRPGDRWRVEGGLRGEALSSRGWFGLSPRVSVKWLPRRQLAFTVAAGRFTQTMHSIAADGPLRLFDVWLASDRFIPVASATHWVAGTERHWGQAGSVRLEGFFKRYHRVLERNMADDGGRRGDEFLLAQGDSRGADLYARWHSPRGASGWLSYTYAVSERWRDGTAGPRWAPSHDRRHDLNAVAMLPLRKYRVSMRFGLATGTPHTPIVGEIVRRVYDPSRDRWGTGDPRLFVEPLGGARNGARFPTSHRLDLEVSREFRRGRTATTPYISVVNAYNAQNVFVYLYDYSTDHPTRQALSQFPILPSVGVRVAF